MAIKMVRLNPDTVRSLINWPPGSVVYRTYFRFTNQRIRILRYILQPTARGIHYSSSWMLSQAGKKKRPPNKRRERARRRWEAWIKRRNHSSPSSDTAILTTAAACTAAAADMTAAAETAAVTLSAAAKRAAAAQATTATARISSAVPATTAAAATADVVMGTSVRVKAVATTAAALREQSKLWAGVKGLQPGHQFLIRGEIQLSVILRNHRRKFVTQSI
jgi:hypothetical protein